MISDVWSRFVSLCLPWLFGILLCLLGLPWLNTGGKRRQGLLPKRSIKLLLLFGAHAGVVKRI